MDKGPRPPSSLDEQVCRENGNHFVGITMYSPNYKAKAERLLRSCSRVGVCCKATLLPSDAFGPGAPEGSEQFRFETIASKPSFILEELEATQHPVVFLDTDLEFHRYTYYGEAYYGDAYYGNTYFGETHYLPTYHRPRVSQVRCYLRTYSLTNLLTY